jgi:hypothetical protein
MVKEVQNPTGRRISACQFLAYSIMQHDKALAIDAG